VNHSLRSSSESPRGAGLTLMNFASIKLFQYASSVRRG
jgi:hypothetical protein